MRLDEVLKNKNLYGDHLKEIHKINEWYRIYEGDQEWVTAEGLDYTPTKKITNHIKNLIDRKARFMFGKQLFFDIRPLADGEGSDETKKQRGQEKEDLLESILRENKFHSKLIKAFKDSCIAGRVAIKLWANKEEGLKIIFVPAQEFIIDYDTDDIDQINKITYVYALNDAPEEADQRIKKQTWELDERGMCILNEATYDGYGRIVSIEEENKNTELDFIPAIIVRNGGLTGDTKGDSDVKALWDNQDAYNKLTSDDIDALKFQMFGQAVATDAAESSLENIKIAPGALIDLQTDETKAGDKQAKMERLESNFSYKDKFEDTINRIKNDMHETIGVPNIGLEQLKGLMQSGKSMKALYWELKAVCDEAWTEWEAALEEMADKIFKMVEVYNLYDAAKTAAYETGLEIMHSYPISDDELEQKQIDMAEVTAEVRSRESYMNKWGNYEDIKAELEQIQLEKRLLEDSYTQELLDTI